MHRENEHTPALKGKSGQHQAIRNGNVQRMLLFTMMLILMMCLISNSSAKAHIGANNQLQAMSVYTLNGARGVDVNIEWAINPVQSGNFNWIAMSLTTPQSNDCHDWDVWSGNGRVARVGHIRADEQTFNNGDKVYAFGYMINSLDVIVKKRGPAVNPFGTQNYKINEAVGGGLAWHLDGSNFWIPWFPPSGGFRCTTLGGWTGPGHNAMGIAGLLNPKIYWPIGNWWMQVDINADHGISTAPYSYGIVPGIGGIVQVRGDN